MGDSDEPPLLPAMPSIAVRHPPEIVGVGVLIACVAVSLTFAALLTVLALRAALW